MKSSSLIKTLGVGIVIKAVYKSGTKEEKEATIVDFVALPNGVIVAIWIDNEGNVYNDLPCLFQVDTNFFTTRNKQLYRRKRISDILKVKSICRKIADAWVKIGLRINTRKS